MSLKGVYNRRVSAYAIAALFLERSFQDAKQEVGMSQCQVRGWLAWHHHMVMVMIALHFILSEKILFKKDIPLLSAYDVREIMLNVYPRKGMTLNLHLNTLDTSLQMKNRFAPACAFVGTRKNLDIVIRQYLKN